MPVYVFYPTLDNGLCNTFQGIELDCDDAAAERALQCLDEHPSAAAVVVYCEQRKVLTRWRRRPVSESMPAPGASRPSLRAQAQNPEAGR